MTGDFLIDDARIRALSATRQGRVSIGGFNYQASYAVARLASMLACQPLLDLGDSLRRSATTGRKISTSSTPTATRLSRSASASSTLASRRSSLRCFYRSRRNYCGPKVNGDPNCASASSAPIRVRAAQLKKWERDKRLRAIRDSIIRWYEAVGARPPDLDAMMPRSDPNPSRPLTRGFNTLADAFRRAFGKTGGFDPGK